MMHVKDYEKWLAKKFAREESKSGWDGDTGKFHEDRRTPRFATMGLSYERKSFGRRPFSTFGKRSFADRLKSG